MQLEYDDSRCQARSDRERLPVARGGSRSLWQQFWYWPFIIVDLVGIQMCFAALATWLGVKIALVLYRFYQALKYGCAEQSDAAIGRVVLVPNCSDPDKRFGLKPLDGLYLHALWFCCIFAFYALVFSITHRNYLANHQDAAGLTRLAWFLALVAFLMVALILVPLVIHQYVEGARKRESTRLETKRRELEQLRQEAERNHDSTRVREIEADLTKQIEASKLIAEQTIFPFGSETVKKWLMRTVAFLAFAAGLPILAANAMPVADIVEGVENIVTGQPVCSPRPAP